MPNAPALERITSANGSDLRQLEIQFNKLLAVVEQIQIAQTADAFIGWYGVGANSGGLPMKIGTTDTRVGTAAMTFSIAGVPVVKAADAAGTTTGALGTVPASTWAVVALDVVAAGTVTFASGAANYTTGYATEAEAIAALPPRTTVKARFGYITVLASASTFVFATDAFAGGSSGTPATTTNYYPAAGISSPQGLATGANGVVSCYVAPTGSPWTGGKNGVLEATAMQRGSTDTRFATTAFMFNAGGMTNIPKAAVAAGTAFGALGTIPANKWGVIAGLIDGAGTITYISGPSNYTTGYNSETEARQALASMYPSANLCMFGYVTIWAQAANAFIVGTDALAGGSTGNEAQGTGYYPTPGVTYQDGSNASPIANTFGTVLSSANY